MSALIGGLAFAALFILFGVLPRRGTSCLDCGGQEHGMPSCPGCPYAGERPVSTEGERK